MRAYITGTGWVTPLGDEIREVWASIQAGTAAPVHELPGPGGGRSHFYAPVPPKPADPLVRNPRLRRSSAISYFAATAGLAALAAGGITDFPGWSERGALIFAVSSGGVIYTRKFYEQIVREGSGSPLLFPETVYNAPASHLAALMGLTGQTYTLVGDATVGLSALSFATDLLESGSADHCLIVGAEEADWVLCEAYRAWRLAKASPQASRGMLLAEGAAAILLAREGGMQLTVTDGVPFFRRSKASRSLGTALELLKDSPAPGTVISSANGTFADAAESQAVETTYGTLPTVFPKHSLGDALGASALLQVICAAQLADERAPVLVPVVGLNHQAAAALVFGPSA